MFDYLYEWIRNIAFYLVMITAVMHVVPNPDYKRYIRFFTGLVLTVMLTSPVLKLMGTEGTWKELYDSREYRRQLRKIEEAAQYLNRNAAETEPENAWLEDMWDEEGGSIDIEKIQIER